jgi:hypothetical protein
MGVEYFPEILRNRGYIVMEKIDGVSILHKVYESGAFNEKDAKTLM